METTHEGRDCGPRWRGRQLARGRGPREIARRNVFSPGARSSTACCPRRSSRRTGRPSSATSPTCSASQPKMQCACCAPTNGATWGEWLSRPPDPSSACVPCLSACATRLGRCSSPSVPRCQSCCGLWRPRGVTGTGDLRRDANLTKEDWFTDMDAVRASVGLQAQPASQQQQLPPPPAGSQPTGEVRRPAASSSTLPPQHSCELAASRPQERGKGGSSCSCLCQRRRAPPRA